ncbi:MAG: AAA family ATPase [Chitinophagales bacterium]|nr:AAA family ATPase [Chitinophagales bacterium]
MPDYNSEILQLQAALQYSPNNLPLLHLLANTYFKYQFYTEAEATYKEALLIDPQNKELKLGLAHAFYACNKTDAAHIVVEELLAHQYTAPSLYMLLARLCFAEKDYKNAKENYEIAVSKDKFLADNDFLVEINHAINQNKLAVPMSHNADEVEDEDGFFTEILEKPNINFSDVGGMENVKEEIALKIIHPLRNPDIYKAFGKKIGGGILLYGPPGCGKTHLARATAGEINAAFIAVGINDVLDMWMGNSEKNLHEIFDTARTNAPCVLFFDEVDALGASRSDMRNATNRFLINQFLDELDGVKYNNDGILVLGATNSPWYLDTAFKRPGRFDRLIFVAPPDKIAREKILDILLAEKPIDKVDTKIIAQMTEGFSGADLKAVVDLAIESKIPESIRQNRLVPLNTNDLRQVSAQYKPTTREWLQTARNYALYSNESGSYNDILTYLNLKK